MSALCAFGLFNLAPAFHFTHLQHAHLHPTYTVLLIMFLLFIAIPESHISTHGWTCTAAFIGNTLPFHSILDSPQSLLLEGQLLPLPRPSFLSARPGLTQGYTFLKAKSPGGLAQFWNSTWYMAPFLQC